MQRTAVRAQIANNLRDRGFSFADDDVRVQPDPYLGWRVAVVSEGFAALSQAERRALALKGLESELFQSVDLLTPEEQEWAGHLPIDADVEDLPFWPEALARPEPLEPPLFASDLDEDIKKPVVATFYSLRGGVGRSTALVYTAKALARRGRSVLCVDLDLEAPGLAALFGKEDAVERGTGLVALLLQIEQGEDCDFLSHIIRISPSDELYCLPAGVPDADYARRLRMIDPEAFYRLENNPMHRLLDLLAALPLQPDVILLDARTGISPISAPLLFDLSDLAIVAFFPHPQAFTGTGELVQGLLKAHSRRRDGDRPLTPDPRFLISPIPPREVERYQRRAEEWAQGWLSALNQRRGQQTPEIDAQEILHLVPYREVIASSDAALEQEEILHLYEPVANWIDRFLPTRSEAAVSQQLQERKTAMLHELAFSAGTAEMRADFLKTFVPVGMFQKASMPDRPLVVGRKGTGKTALFRWLAEDGSAKSIVVTSPADFRTRYHWTLGPDSFELIETALKDAGAGWRQFWTLYTALAAQHVLHAVGRDQAPEDASSKALLDDLMQAAEESEVSYVRRICAALHEPEVALLAWDWLQQIDRRASAVHFLLFDGLDTGFGNMLADRTRRKEALEGLFAFVLDREHALRSLKFKVLLREDIFKRLRFENKSHLEIRAVYLQWRTEAEYARPLLQQALQSQHFADYVAQNIKGISGLAVESWPEQIVFEVWNLLVGDRMKGGKSSYTRSWVWNRLADGNGDHSPRSLFRLFEAAVQWERREQPKNPYGKSIIRPRALIEGLADASHQALDALLEEFGELEGLVGRLREIGRSPVDTAALQPDRHEAQAVEEQIHLAQEVGLLEIYEKAEEEIRRYKIPDLYRLALGMTRKGRA